MAPYIESNLTQATDPLFVDLAPTTIATSQLTAEDTKTASGDVATGSDKSAEAQDAANKPPPLQQGPVDPSSAHLYDLFAVVIHQGGAHGGHYHALIRDVAARWVRPALNRGFSISARSGSASRASRFGMTSMTRA